MNSLTYLSRQFDVLAAARTPPSTPTQENAPLADVSSTLKRVQTWSKASLAEESPSSSSGSWSLKRSYSSPAEVHPADPPLPQSPSTPPRRPSISVVPPSPARRPSIVLPDSPVRPKSRSESVLHHLLLFRVLLSLWHHLIHMWRSLADKLLPRAAHEVAAEEASDEEDKDTEDEAKEEKVPLLVVQEPPPIPPPTYPGPPLVQPSPISPIINPPHRDVDARPPLFEIRSATSSEYSLVLHHVAIIRPADSDTSRTPTPTLSKGKTPLHQPKTLVLDLDETLIHSTSRPMSHAPGSGLLNSFGIGRRNKGAGHMVEVVLGGRSTLYHVYKRPFVDYFLRKVSAWYTLVIFTASMQEYADPVIDWLDAGRGILARRLFRESCTQLPNGSYTKDLSIIEQDLSRVCLVDNSPVCYSINQANGIPIEGWTNDPHDEALLDLLPVLDSLRFTSDVRRVLGIRGFS